jgi:hypothetical protein
MGEDGAVKTERLRKLLVGGGWLDLIIWDVAERKTRAVLKKHSGQVTTVAISPDGKLLATMEASVDGGAFLWDLSTGKALCRLKTKIRGSVFTGLVFAPDSKTIAVGGPGRVELWDASGAKIWGMIKGPFNSKCLAFARMGSCWPLALRQERCLFTTCQRRNSAGGGSACRQGRTSIRHFALTITDLKTSARTAWTRSGARLTEWVGITK